MLERQSRYPEVLKNSSPEVVILNLHGDMTTKRMSTEAYKLMGKALNVFDSSSERKKFGPDFSQNVVVTDRTLEYGRVKVLHLPNDLYKFTKEPTTYTWGRTAVRDLPADEAVLAFGTSREECQNKELILAPPAQEELGKYVEATEEVLGKTPHIAFMHEILYLGDTWNIYEYQPGMKNTMEHIIGAI